ncbi:unnamed protein product [Rangifer tarandus platyrhynchus]|uniref:Uncharacterized protein n=1 Tax=Rangifer tarandus platyrhynchus TaxID=3082113 RepID=A0AC59ZAK6_RANTA
MQKDGVSSKIHSPPKAKVKAASWPGFLHAGGAEVAGPTLHPSLRKPASLVGSAGQLGGGANHAVGRSGLSPHGAPGARSPRSPAGRWPGTPRSSVQREVGSSPRSPGPDAASFHRKEALSPRPRPSAGAPSSHQSDSLPGVGRELGAAPALPLGDPGPSPSALHPLTSRVRDSSFRPGKPRPRSPRARNRERKCGETAAAAASFPFRDVAAPGDLS